MQQVKPIGWRPRVLLACSQFQATIVRAARIEIVGIEDKLDTLYTRLHAAEEKAEDYLHHFKLHRRAELENHLDDLADAAADKLAALDDRRKAIVADHEAAMSATNDAMDALYTTKVQA